MIRPQFTASIVTGTKTNRVRVKRRQQSAGTARKAYRSDPAVRGMDTAVFCASMPVGELEQLDAVCAEVQMARSHFIRQAVKHFAVFVRGGAKK